MSVERQIELIRREIEDITRGIEELKRNNGEKFSIKQMMKNRCREVDVIEKCSSFFVSPTLFEEL